MGRSRRTAAKHGQPNDTHHKEKHDLEAATLSKPDKAQDACQHRRSQHWTGGTAVKSGAGCGYGDGELGWPVRERG